MCTSASLSIAGPEKGKLPCCWGGAVRFVVVLPSSCHIEVILRLCSVVISSWSILFVFCGSYIFRLYCGVNGCSQVSSCDEEVVPTGLEWIPTVSFLEKRRWWDAWWFKVRWSVRHSCSLLIPCIHFLANENRNLNCWGRWAIFPSLSLAFPFFALTDPVFGGFLLDFNSM